MSVVYFVVMGLAVLNTNKQQYANESKSLDSISSHLHASDYDVYIQRLRERIPAETGISFEDFKQFCQFLNNLDDFSIAMRMYTFAGKTVRMNCCV